MQRIRADARRSRHARTAEIVTGSGRVALLDGRMIGFTNADGCRPSARALYVDPSLFAGGFVPGPDPGALQAMVTAASAAASAPLQLEDCPLSACPPGTPEDPNGEVRFDAPDAAWLPTWS